MKIKRNNITTLEQVKDKNYGKRGNAKREQLEAGYESFKIGALIHEARLEKGMTQKVNNSNLNKSIATENLNTRRKWK